MKIIKSLCLVLFVVFVVAGQSAAANTELSNIPLEWKPTYKYNSFSAIDTAAYQNIVFTIQPFKDTRERPAEIGKNIEKKNPIGTELLVTTKDDVAAWLTGRTVQLFVAFDVNAVKSGGSVSLETDIVKFFVTEKSVYEGEVALKVRLISKSGAVLWEGATSGKSTRFGRSYKADNYYETLSNATVIAVHALLNDDSFKKAVQKIK